MDASATEFMDRNGIGAADAPTPILRRFVVCGQMTDGNYYNLVEKAATARSAGEQVMARLGAERVLSLHSYETDRKK